jgi:hypothetical protein
VEGRKGYAETNPELVREAKRLARKSPKTGEKRSLREIAEELEKLGLRQRQGPALRRGAGGAAARELSRRSAIRAQSPRVAMAAQQ